MKIRNPIPAFNTKRPAAKRLDPRTRQALRYDGVARMERDEDQRLRRIAQLLHYTIA